MLSSNNALCSSRSIKPPKAHLLPYKCGICDAPADYSYFGVVSCRSCKMFFKRNGTVEPAKRTCNHDDQCEINIHNRKICTSCRLAKCFRMGMTTDRFRASLTKKKKLNYSKTKNIVSRTEIQNQLEKLPTLKLLQSNQSLLSIDQWTLFSSLLKGYEESKLLSIGQRLIDTHDQTQSTDIIYQSLVQEFITTVFETTGTYLLSNGDFCHLPANDRSIILRSAAGNVSCLGFAFITHHFHLLNLEVFSKIIEFMYGKRSLDMHLWARKFIDSDIVLIKLAISLFAISEKTYSYVPNSSTVLTNSISILHIQNKYAEITWKYLLYKYGHHQAVKRFLNLTSWLEAMTMFMFHVQTVMSHANHINTLVERTELALILDDVDEIFETNE